MELSQRDRGGAPLISFRYNIDEKKQSYTHVHHLQKKRIPKDIDETTVG